MGERGSARRVGVGSPVSERDAYEAMIARLEMMTADDVSTELELARAAVERERVWVRLLEVASDLHRLGVGK
jgi:predicted transcriptional regulator